MAFKLVKVIGDGSTKEVLSVSAENEAVITSIVAYNSTTSDTVLTLKIDDVAIVNDSVVANNKYTISDKINVPAGTTVAVDTVDGLDVVVNYFEQAIDSAAAYTSVQALVAEAENTITSIINDTASDDTTDKVYSVAKVESTFLVHVEADDEPSASSYKPGDTWYDTNDNKLYKLVTVDGTMTWLQIV